MSTWRARHCALPRGQAMAASRALRRGSFPVSFLCLRARFCCWRTRESRGGDTARVTSLMKEEMDAAISAAAGLGWGRAAVSSSVGGASACGAVGALSRQEHLE
jgi:porphobilinogen deaminase